MESPDSSLIGTLFGALSQGYFWFGAFVGFCGAGFIASQQFAKQERALKAEVQRLHDELRAIRAKKPRARKIAQA